MAWVQSYGSRYVRPPIIVSDVSRPEAMTVRWSAYAQSLSKLPVKGMLTGASLLPFLTSSSPSLTFSTSLRKIGRAHV